MTAITGCVTTAGCRAASRLERRRLGLQYLIFYFEKKYAAGRAADILELTQLTQADLSQVPFLGS
jgi:hypothetical protein